MGTFTVREFHDFVRILERRPDWREELRRLMLTDELLELPKLVRELVEAQRRTEEELGTLTARVDTLTQRVDELAEAQEVLTRRVDSLTQRVEELAEAQRKTEQRLNELAEAQKVLTRRVDSLAEAQRKTEETVRKLAIDVAELKGDSLERKYREKAPSYFAPLLRRARVLPAEELWDVMDRGIEEGVLTRDEAKEVLDADVVVLGRKWTDGKEEYLIVEVSWSIGTADVERAARRAELLRRLGLDVRAVVAGRGINPEAESLAAEKGVERVIDGRVFV